MATALLPTRGIVLVGAPDRDMELRDTHSPPMQAMQVDMAQDLVDELLESLRSGKAPQIVFGRTPQLKYGDKTHVLQSSTESHRCELYKPSGDGDGELAFAGLINHSLTVQQAEHVTAGVDSALQQLKSSMAAITEFKEANKTIVGDATRTPAHRRFPSTGFKAQHLAAPSHLGSPLLSTPSSPMHRRPPTSQPGGPLDVVINALRVPVIHLLARQPATEASLSDTCHASLANMRALLPKIAKRPSPDSDMWQLADKAFREINPYKFPYQSAHDREQAIDSAIKAFDRQRLAKDDKLWQMLLPRVERGQGTCLSRSKVKAPEPKPKPKPSTPMHKISDLTKKKPAAKKADDKPVDKKPRVAKEPDVKAKPVVKERPLVSNVKYEPKKAPAPSTGTPSSTRPTAPADRYTSSTSASKIRTKKAPARENTSAPRPKPKMSQRHVHRDRSVRPVKPAMPINTKPKNPSPLSASPPVNASDFEDTHPVHKALAAAVSPAKAVNGSSDRSLKRKANDIDSDLHNHNLAVKKPHVDRATPNHTPSHTNGRLNGSTPSSMSSLKRKSESSTSNTPATAPKVRKMNGIDTGIASRDHNNSQASPVASSSSAPSPTMPSLSFRQTVELSQRFQKYYKKYEELYWQLTESDKSPTESQRNELLNMHKKLEEMKREIKAGASVHG